MLHHFTWCLHEIYPTGVKVQKHQVNDVAGLSPSASQCYYRNSWSKMLKKVAMFSDEFHSQKTFQFPQPMLQLDSNVCAFMVIASIKIQHNVDLSESKDFGKYVVTIRNVLIQAIFPSIFNLHLPKTSKTKLQLKTPAVGVVGCVAQTWSLEEMATPILCNINTPT